MDAEEIGAAIATTPDPQETPPQETPPQEGQDNLDTQALSPPSEGDQAPSGASGLRFRNQAEAERAYAELHSAYGQQSGKVGELNQLQQRLADMEARIAQAPQTTPQPQQPTEEQLLEPYLNDARMEVWRYLADMGYETDKNNDAEGYEKTVRELHQRSVEIARKEFARDQRAYQSAYAAMEASNAPMRLKQTLDNARQRAGFHDVTDDEIAQAVETVARTHGMLAGDARAQLSNLDPATLELAVWAAKGRKGALASSPRARATPQRPVGTGPGVAPSAAPPDRQVQETATRLKAQWFSHMPDKDAEAAALEAAREMFGV